LKNKTAKEGERGLMIILNQVKSSKIRTDEGSEFNHKWVKTLLENKHIYHHVTMNEVKANYVEIFNRTMKTMIYRYLNRNKTRKYLDVLPKLIETYNATPHRSLNNIVPKDVNETNEADMWAYMYLKPKHMNVKKEKMKRKRLFRFKIGQLVRISHQRRAFTRAYNEQWSYEVFKIKRRFQMQGIPMYKLVDMLESEIKGNFYQPELQAVDKSEDTLWEVEKIVRKQ
jgi:hypothetical protein